VLEPLHVGLVVPALEAGMSAMGEELGLTWTPIREARLGVADSGGPRSFRMRVVNSEGRFSVELIEAVPNSIFQPVREPGWHHVAFRTSVLHDDVSRLEGRGYQREIWGCGPDGSLTYFCYLIAPSNQRVELVSRREES